jgi:hypothetical protein
MKTPTIEPAVPGATGENPAPPAVAIAMAAQSLLVFTIAIRSVDFLRRAFVGRNAKFAPSPSTQVDQLATLAAERPVRVTGILGFFVTRGTFHGLWVFSRLARKTLASAEGVGRVPPI